MTFGVCNAFKISPSILIDFFTVEVAGCDVIRQIVN
jgi:hypothetical protein